MEQGERDGVPLRGAVDGQLAAFDVRVRDPVVPEGGQGAEAAGVDEVAVVVEHVDVCAQGPYFLAGYEAEGFGGEGLGAAEGGFEGAGEVGFEVGLAGGS